MGHRFVSVVLLALVVGLVGGCADDPATSPTPDTSTTTSAAPTSTEPPPEPADPGALADEAAAMAVVDDWLATIGTGDAELVRSGTGPVSQRALDAMGGIESIMSGLAEGMASFGQPGLERAAVAVPGQEGAWLVTYFGDVTSEGMTNFAAHSWLVVPGEGGAKVEAFAVPLPEVLAPQDPTAARADETVTVTLPAAGEVVAVLDGSTPLPGPLVEGIDGDQVQVSAAPEDGLPTGRHVITVAVVPQAGATVPWATTAVAFTVG